MSLLALSVRIFGDPRYLMAVDKSAFYPAPKIDSAVVRIDLFDTPLVPLSETDLFFRMIKAGFAQKRKTLRNSLTSGLGLGREKIESALSLAAIDPARRAETLTIPEWLTLQNELFRE